MKTKTKTKTKSHLLLFALLFMFVLTSCETNDGIIPKPTISGLELGIGNSHIAYIGADLHIEAEIVSEGKISKITIEIHQEEGGSDEIEVEYDEFEGMKNATFHKHIEIPSTTNAGTYHCHIIITDMIGNSTTVEEEIVIEELADEQAPIINISLAPTNRQVFAYGDIISISGTITDNNALAGMLVALVYEDDNIADADVSGNNEKVIVMLHTHDFDDADEISFNASVEVGSVNDKNRIPAIIDGENAWKSGNYYLLVTSKDAKLNGATSIHYPIQITL